MGNPNPGQRSILWFAIFLTLLLFFFQPKRDLTTHALRGFFFFTEQTQEVHTSFPVDSSGQPPDKIDFFSLVDDQGLVLAELLVVAILTPCAYKLATPAQRGFVEFMKECVSILAYEKY